jgi:hypothetical protein
MWVGPEEEPGKKVERVPIEELVLNFRKKEVFNFNRKEIMF